MLCLKGLEGGREVGYGNEREARLGRRVWFSSPLGREELTYFLPFYRFSRQKKSQASNRSVKPSSTDSSNSVDRPANVEDVQSQTILLHESGRNRNRTTQNYNHINKHHLLPQQNLILHPRLLLLQLRLRQPPFRPSKEEEEATTTLQRSKLSSFSLFAKEV